MFLFDELFEHKPKNIYVIAKDIHALIDRQMAMQLHKKYLVAVIFTSNNITIISKIILEKWQINDIESSRKRLTCLFIYNSGTVCKAFCPRKKTNLRYVNLHCQRWFYFQQLVKA